jgi:hypothetical protein
MQLKTNVLFGQEATKSDRKTSLTKLNQEMIPVQREKDLEVLFLFKERR